MSEQVSRGKTQDTARKTRGGRSITTGILLLPVVAVLFPSCMILVAGMVPSIVAYMVDRTNGKYLAITVGLMNFCGTLLGLTKLWQAGHTYGAAMRIVMDPVHWLASYGAAGGGWIIYLSLPPILSVYYSSVSTKRTQVLKRKQAEIVETWGPEVVPAHSRDPSEN